MGAGLVVAAVAAGLTLTAVPALAAPTSVVVSAGALAVTTPAVNDFAVVVLDGAATTARTSLERFSVTDARGSGQGWTLSVQASPFREWDGTAYVADGKSLPPGSLTLAGVSVTAVDTDSAAPAILPGPYPLDGPAVTVAAAAAGTGMGTFAFAATSGLVVAVPAHAYARAYRSELAISVASGP